MKKIRFFSSVFVSVLLVLGWVSFKNISQGDAASNTPTCDNPGWFPEDFGLKDHSVFDYNGYYYLVSNYVPPGDVSPLVQDRFAYARSMDMCTWDELDPVLATRTPGAWDEQAIWAPYVFLDGITYYMYYTGVTSTGTQSIMLATTTSPSNPASWQPQGMVFQPDHEGFVWEDGKWADCRDPTVVKYEEKYYLYYTGSDVTGGIIGMAVSSDLKGPWIDQGGIVSPEPEAMLESPTIVRHGEYYYLIYNLASVGGYYRIGNNLDGPWQNPDEFRPGWAHEVWQNMADDWYTSYLTDYTVTISPLTWDDFFDPPRLVVGGTVFHEFLPLILFNSDSNAK